MNKYVRMIEKGVPCSVASVAFGGRHEQYYYRLSEFEDKLENGTLVELPKKCYQVVYVLGWEILEYDIIEIKYSHTEGIISVKATRPHTIEYFTNDTRYEDRAIGVDVFFSEAEAKAKLAELEKRDNGQNKILD